MGLLQRKTRCTVHDGHGGTCGRKDQCTHVVTENAAGPLHEHDVCPDHRKLLDLPEWDVTISPEGVVRRVR